MTTVKARFTHGTDLYCIAPELMNAIPANGFKNNDVWVPSKNQKGELNYHLLDVLGLQTFSPGGDPADQIETTTLKDTARQYISGLITPTQANFTLYFDPDLPQHVHMFRLAKSNDPLTQNLQFAIGLSDSTAAAKMIYDRSKPDVDPVFDFNAMNGKRTWIFFNGYFSDFPFDFSQNSAVTCSVTITRVGNTKIVAKNVM